MKFLLDTNAVIAILNGNQDFIAKLKQHSPSDFGMPSIVLFELVYGAYKSQQVEKNLSKLDLIPFEVVSFTAQDALQAGKIRAELSKQGKPIGTYDVQIAGMAIRCGLTLITHNVKEFERVLNLKIEDWQTP